MKKILTFLITSALLVGCGLTDKGMDRKINLDDGAAFVDVLSSAIDETTPEQGEIIRTYIPSLISSANIDYKTTLSKKALNAIDGKSIKEVLITHFDSQIEYANRSLADKRKASSVKFELVSIQTYKNSAYAELNVENTTDWDIEGFSFDGVSTISGKNSKIIWGHNSYDKTAIKPRGNVTIKIQGNVALDRDETSNDLTNAQIESNFEFVAFWLKGGKVITSGEQDALKTIETFKKYKAVILGNSESASEQSVATTEQKQSTTTADKSKSTSQQSQSTSVAEQLYKYEPSTYTLKGVLQSVAGETPDGGKLTFPAIKLEQPITVQGDGETPTEKSVTLMQLVLNAETQQVFVELEGKTVSITGTMFHADNANHQTNVLIAASAISSKAE